MKKTINPGDTPPAWDPSALYTKAHKYVQKMSELSSDDEEYALWSSLSLELLARAALANISPALLADSDNNTWQNIYNALGFPPTEEKFSPKSIPISSVFRRLTAIIPDFVKEYENFGIQHTGRRNSELHSGELAFDGVKGSSWQPGFYQTCEVLLRSMEISLDEYVGKDEADAARKIIAAAADESAKAVKGEVEAHKKVWLAKKQDERDTLSKQATIWATRHRGHRVTCPSCESTAIVVGDPVSSPTQRLHNGEITETHEYLPSRFECTACGLRISDLSRLTVIGLGDRYKKTFVYDTAEYYAPDDEFEGYEDDNNEW